jgi:hypothetical protein
MSMGRTKSRQRLLGLLGLFGLRAAFELKQNKTKTTPQGRGNRAPVSAGQRAPFSTISANPSEVL